ncbi:hypothetical protein P9112_002653 [Eukaryota sp. TZLM1-RC]
MPRIAPGSPFSSAFTKYVDVLRRITELSSNDIIILVQFSDDEVVPFAVRKIGEVLAFLFTNGGHYSYDYFCDKVLAPISSPECYSPESLQIMTITFINMFLSFDIGDLNVSLYRSLRVGVRELSNIPLHQPVVLLLEYVCSVLELMRIQCTIVKHHSLSPFTDLVCSISFKNLQLPKNSSTVNDDNAVHKFDEFLSQIV